ncbi:3083_t:CDS:2, partial [Gigaspora margarita]
LQSPEVNTRKINLGTIKIQLLGVIETVNLINKTDNNETTQYILRQLQGLTDIIQQDLHIIEITGELPKQHTDRFIEESQEPDLSRYNLATSQDSKAHTINEMKQTIIMIYFIKEKTPLQERLEGYLEQEKKNYPELDQYIKNKEWNNQQYDLSSLISNIYKYTKTEENVTDLIINEHDNFELSDLKARIKLAKTECLHYYLSILKIRRLRKTGQLPTKKEIEKLTNEKMHQNPLNLKNTFNTKKQPLENKLFQVNPTISRIFGRKNIQWKDTTIENKISISEQAEKYKELREKMNNIFDKPSKEEILKTLNQDPFTYTSKLTSTRVQLLTKYEVKFTEAKLPFNKPYELTNILPFNGPLFNRLTLIEHLEESLYIRIAANKKNQLTEEQYQDWKKQMDLKIEHQHNYNTLYNEGKQFSLKTIIIDQIQEGYNNLHRMLNHDQIKLNFIAIDGAIAVEKTTTCHWLKT